VDFGIAKVAGRLSSTQAGTLKGKVAYMSPEQVKGQPIDRRTDIFALGVVLWELTMGRRLFRVDSDLATLSRVEACEVPPPSSMDEDYPPELESVVLRALERDAADRFQTAREFSRALQQFLMQGTAVVGPAEISAYVTGLFVDRVRSREDHLRWAAEVTQTISIKEALTSPESSDDLLDLAQLPRDSAELDSVDFDTIREQRAPAARRDVPSPLGEVGTDSTTGKLPPHGQAGKGGRSEDDLLAKTQKSTSLPQRHPQVEVRDSSTHTNDQKQALGAKGNRTTTGDDFDEDSIETLIASAPHVLNTLMADVRAIAERSMRDEPPAKKHDIPEPEDEPEPDSLVRTTAYVRTGEGPAVQFERAKPREGALPKVSVVREPEVAAEPEPQPAWLPQAQEGKPVFERGASRAAETIQIRAVRPPSLLVMAAAALGAGFVAAGLAALLWARERPPATRTTATASITVPASAATSAPSAGVDVPVDAVAVARVEAGAEPEHATPRTKEPSRPVAQPPPAASEEGSIADSLPDFPPPEPKEPPRGTGKTDDEVEPGTLTVTCRPACDQIIAGGSTFGGSAVRAPMPPGQYRVRLRRGDVEKVVSVIVVSGQDTRQSVSMEK
jgi:serine/threonine-protein kinase